MEVLLGWVNLAAGWPGLVTQWQQPGARAEPATIRQDWELISGFARDPAHIWHRIPTCPEQSPNMQTEVSVVICPTSPSPSSGPGVEGWVTVAAGA